MRHTKKRDFSIFFFHAALPLLCLCRIYIVVVEMVVYFEALKILSPLPLCIFVYERTWGFFKSKDLVSSIISPFVVISPSIPSDDVGKKIQINISHTENGKELPLIDNRSWPLWMLIVGYGQWAWFSGIRIFSQISSDIFM